MNHSEQRQRMRAMFMEQKCHFPASIFDPLSARVAEAVGYELAMLAGSVASNTTLAAPDFVLITLTELADQIRRIMRVSSLSLLVDADHGYGNALNAMRTVAELEHAGVSAVCIEDTDLPKRFGRERGKLISSEEMVGKLRASLEARQDPSLLIVARTQALSYEDTERTVARVREYVATGIDAVFTPGLKTLDQLKAIRSATQLPILLGKTPGITIEDLTAHGARMILHGHQSVAASVKALFEVFTHLYNGGAPSELKSKIASPEQMSHLVKGDNYKEWQREFMR